MQLQSLTLNFGQHRKRSWNFGPGITVIRGPNESGKSTLITGWMYNWFGADILAENIDAYVPRGEKKSSLQTRSTFMIDGQEFECKRGASGAELLKGGAVLATNHGPVTAKIEELLGIPPGKVAMTIYAAQSEIRGALALKPTAAAAYIEGMADFTQVDTLLKMLSEKLETGNASFYEAQIGNKELELIQQQELPTEAPESHQQTVGILSHKITQLTDELSSLKAAANSTAEYNKAIETSRAALLREQATIASTAATRQRLEQTIAAAAGAKELIEEYNRRCLAAQKWASYKSFTELTESTDAWDGDLDSFNTEIKVQTDLAQSAQLKIRGLESTIAAKKKQRLTTPVCPYTKTDCPHLTDPAVIERTNAEIQREVSEMEAQVAAFIVQKNEANEIITLLNNLVPYQSKREKLLEQLPFDVAADKEQVPWRLTWTSEVPSTAEYPTENVDALQRLVNAAATAQAQVVVLPPIAPGRAAAIAQELENLPVVKPTTELEKQIEQKSTEKQTAEAQRLQHQQTLDQIQRAQQNRESNITRLSGELGKLRAQLSLVQENDDFIKAVRAARLMIADLLWSKILAGASNYFSRMRGVESVIRRTPKGFVANDDKLLSGSTLDILGLALRITTAKLFSRCSILVLDEANAGADQDRSASMVGTLASAGFSQVFLVTHKDIDEAGCDHLLNL